MLVADPKLEPASLLDLRADDERLLSALSRQHRISVRRTDLSVLQNLSSQLRDSAWQARVALREDEVVAVSSPESRWLGLAVDLGTTKIAGYLTDLESKIINKIDLDNTITMNKIANDLKISKHTVAEYIKKLKTKKVLERIGSTKGGYWKVHKESL